KMDDQRAVSYASFARATMVDAASGDQSAAVPAEQAAAFYRKAIEYAPKYAAAYFNYGVLLLQSGQTDEAIETLEAAVRLKPDLADAWNQLGLAHMKKGELRGALLAYEQAIRHQP